MRRCNAMMAGMQCLTCDGTTAGTIHATACFVISIDEIRSRAA